MTNLIIELPESVPVFQSHGTIIRKPQDTDNQPEKEPDEKSDKELEKEPDSQSDHKEKPDDSTNCEIGLKVEVVLLNFHKKYEGKIDTGAACCSLGVKDIEHKNDIVVFTLGDHRYKMNCTTRGFSSADGGSEKRPIIKLNCKINDEVYDDIEFNLNDRSHLPDKVLIGLNLIKQLKCKIDPNHQS